MTLVQHHTVPTIDVMTRQPDDAAVTSCWSSRSDYRIYEFRSDASGDLWRFRQPLATSVSVRRKPPSSFLRRNALTNTKIARYIKQVATWFPSQRLFYFK